jgi:hypothetical protein
MDEHRWTRTKSANIRNPRDDIMPSRGFHPDSLEAAGRLRRLEQMNLNFIRRDPACIDSPRFHEHVAALSPRLPFVVGVLGAGGPTAEYGPDEQRYKATHENFHDAMAAPVKMPEFQGDVAAVLAEKYWDRDPKAARAKDGEVKQRAKHLAKDGNLRPAKGWAALAFAHGSRSKRAGTFARPSPLIGEARYFADGSSTALIA